jgi:hypothetical protein
MIKLGTNTICVINAHLNAWLNQTKMPVMDEIAPEASKSLKENLLTNQLLAGINGLVGEL